jgi:hypothetical protein
MTACDKYAWWRACMGGGVDQRMLAYYAEDGHVELFTAHIDMYTLKCADDAAAYGQARVLNEIIERKLGIRTVALYNALVGGHVQCANMILNIDKLRDWILKNNPCMHKVYYWAGMGGVDASELVINCFENAWEYLRDIVHGAAIGNKWDVIEMLVAKHDCDLFVIGCIAALYGNLEFVKRCPLGETTFVRAVQGGHMDIMEWLYSRECYVRGVHCSMHAELHGSVYLEWLHQHDLYHTSTRAHHYAAHRGRVDSSQWLIAHHHAIPTDIWYHALIGGNIKYAEWLNTHKVPKNVKDLEWAQNIESLVIFARGQSSLKLYTAASECENANGIVESLLEIGIPVCKDAIRACRKMRGRIVQMMIQRCRKH